MKSVDQVGDYLRRSAEVLTAIDPVQVAEVVESLERAWRDDATVFTCGNGGSATTASHLACDLSKQTMVAGRRPLRALSLTDNVALISAWANDAAFDVIFSEQLQIHARAGDVLICISASGNSANIVKAVEEARTHGMRVIGLGGFGGGALAALADSYVHVSSDDYGFVESAHLVLQHCFTTLLRASADKSRLDARPRPNLRKPVVFVDRDGVINVNRELGVRSWNDFQFVPGSLEALADLTERGHRVAILTNQAGVGRGVLTPAQLTDIHRRMQAAIKVAGGHVEGVYVCPHRPEDECDCRKPKPGLLLTAAKALHVDIADTYFIGDHVSDVEAALAAGARPVLVLSGREQSYEPKIGARANFVAGDLRAAVDVIISKHDGSLTGFDADQAPAERA